MFTDAEVAAATETTICEGEEASTCPTIARTYGDVTDHMFSLADARDLLPRPVKSAVYDQLLYATNRGLDGILAPLTPCTEGLADVIHPGTDGWYLSTESDTWWHLPSDEPIYAISLRGARYRVAMGQGGYVVILANASDRMVFLGRNFQTSRLRYVWGGTASRV